MIAAGNQSLLTDAERLSLESLLPYASEQERAELQALLGVDQTTDLVCKTTWEAAKALGVGEATVDRWLREPGFPGKSGDRGRRNGYFPIAAIRQWAESRASGRAGNAEATSDAKRRKLEAEAATRELELEERLGQLVDRSDVESVVSQQIATARSLLEEIPEAIAAALPAKMPERIKRLVARTARRKVGQALQALAEAAGNASEDDDDDL